MKTINPKESARSPGDTGRDIAQREVNVLERLRHPYIVKVIEHFMCVGDNKLCELLFLIEILCDMWMLIWSIDIVMELVEHGDLYHHIFKKNGLCKFKYFLSCALSNRPSFSRTHYETCGVPDLQCDGGAFIFIFI